MKNPKEIFKIYQELTDNNNYTDAALLLIEAYGTEVEKIKVRQLTTITFFKRKISEDDIKEINNIARRYYIMVRKFSEYLETV